MLCLDGDRGSRELTKDVQLTMRRVSPYGVRSGRLFETIAECCAYRSVLATVDWQDEILCCPHPETYCHMWPITISQQVRELPALRTIILVLLG